ncbi:class I SAM-dependent methyltransferase [Rhodovibrionaceae bacterium A322]
MSFASLLQKIITEDGLTIIDAKGRETPCGPEPSCCRLKLHKQHLNWSLLYKTPVSFAESYMDGSLTLEQGDLRQLMAVITKNYGNLTALPAFKALDWLTSATRHFRQLNPIGNARRNVAHHYDLSGELFDLFLDSDRQYSCAYFPDSADLNDLEQAQVAKKAHLAAKLNLDKPGLSVLDIGSGWGGMALYLAEKANCQVQGITLSEEQLKVSSQRANENGYANQCRFDLKDYRLEDQTYDRIISVGMFEHVGRASYQTYFDKVKELLRDDGVMVLHTIGRFDPPGPVNAFIRKYIFPGGDIPALSEIMTAIEKAGLYLTDVEVLRLHYAHTLKLWYERFQENRTEVAKLYDERFCRLWEFYLAASEMQFRYGDLNNFQLQITKSLTTLPLSRDYLARNEEKLLSPNRKAAAE